MIVRGDHRGIFRPKAWICGLEHACKSVRSVGRWDALIFQDFPSCDVQRPNAFTTALPQAVTAVSSPTVAIKTFSCWAVELRQLQFGSSMGSKNMTTQENQEKVFQTRKNSTASANIGTLNTRRPGLLPYPQIESILAEMNM